MVPFLFMNIITSDLKNDKCNNPSLPALYQI
jgi:hypothetical protein